MLMHRGTRILETQRLLLRPFKIEDAADMFNNWASDEEVTRFYHGIPIAVLKIVEKY